MSVFKKIALLFSVSLLLMFAIGHQIDALNEQRTEMLVTQKYLEDARKLFTLLATTEPDAREAKLASMQLATVEASEAKGATVLLEQPHSFGVLKILKTAADDYLLEIRYMDTALLLSNTVLQQGLKAQWLPKTLVGLDIAVLVAIFFIIVAMLSPLRRITETMRAFAGGDYGRRTAVTSRDEIGEVAATYNEMAQRLQDLIASRAELLRDIGHELRTPIARGMFALEKMPDSGDKALLRRCFTELERLTSELLQIEKLEATGTMQRERFSAETLILQALSKAMAQEEQVTLDIAENFEIEGDPEYLALALKNLIDNAIKYADALPVAVIAERHTICVINGGAPLIRELEHYLQPFNRDEKTLRQSGFGLGLAIVSKVLHRHDLSLHHRYDRGKHRFCIRFQETIAPE